jgi:hypothetical protein
LEQKHHTLLKNNLSRKSFGQGSSGRESLSSIHSTAKNNIKKGSFGGSLRNGGLQQIEPSKLLSIYSILKP